MKVMRWYAVYVACLLAVVGFVSLVTGHLEGFLFLLFGAVLYRLSRLRWLSDDPPPARSKHMRRMDDWVLRHPWWWALGGGVLGLVVGMNNGSLGVGVLLALAAYVVTGWSVSSGPGRRYLLARLGRSEE